MIKTPLRYPGGKSRAVKSIMPLIPHFDEFREPFVGGGSIFLALKQSFSDKKFWINDINQGLYCFWKCLKNNPEQLISYIQKIKDTNYAGKDLHKALLSQVPKSELEQAVRFFILNRITFSGTIESGGFSQSAFEERFTQSSIDKLLSVSTILNDTKITNLDYEKVIEAPGQNVFIFLDPPYLGATKSRLYGRNGDLHKSFDHEKLAFLMEKVKHKWLITYDDNPIIKRMYKFAKLKKWELQYGMNNYKQETAAKGQELFISNY